MQIKANTTKIRSDMLMMLSSSQYGSVTIVPQEPNVLIRVINYTLENHPSVAFSASHSLTVEEFQQRDGVLARNARPVFELGDRKPFSAASAQYRAELVYRSRVIHELVRHAYQALVLY